MPELELPNLNDYLNKYFLNAEQFAAASCISVDELDDLIGGRFIPAPTYTVTDSSSVISFLFGEMEVQGSTPGRYFHADKVAWVKIARETVVAEGAQSTNHNLQKRFATNYRSALADHNASTWRLRDSFEEDGSPIEEGLSTRIDAVWEHFLQGTFGMCVAHPSSEAAIARKDVLQEKLVSLSENGSKTNYSSTTKQTILALIDSYAEASMPFSPIEYELSSRKRLVDDLRVRIQTVDS